VSVSLGSGYEVRAPAGWREVTDRFRRRSGVDVDLAISAPAVDGFATNVNVIRREQTVDVTLDALAVASWKELVVLTGGQDPGPYRDAALAGEPGKVLTYEAPQRDRRLRFSQLLALRDAVLYTVTFTSDARAYERDVAALDAILRSWHWC
jgi:hypothetical protein